MEGFEQLIKIDWQDMQKAGEKVDVIIDDIRAIVEKNGNLEEIQAINNAWFNLHKLLGGIWFDGMTQSQITNKTKDIEIELQSTLSKYRKETGIILAVIK